MPSIVTGRDTSGSGRGGSFATVNASYDYPRDMDLEPGTEQHSDILTRLIERAQYSNRAMADRHEEWRKVDQSLKAHVDADFKQASEEDNAEGQSPRVVLPFSYANLETLLTYMTSAFLDDTLFRYQEIGPEDAHKAYLLERLIEQQANKKKFGLSLHTMWRDAFSYNMGVVAPKWTEEYGTKTQVEEFGFLDAFREVFEITDKERVSSPRQLMYEGHELENIDPYRYLPDPNVPVHEVQKSEFVGWISRSNEMELLRRERDQEGFFNGKYVREGLGDARSDLVMREDSRDLRNRDVNDESTAYNNPVDETWMYVDLIPSEWGLGNSQTPEKWQFGVAGDSVIIAARPLNLDHNRFPVVVASPDFDGHSIAPPSRLEIVQDMQEIIDFLYSSHLMNIRKAINDMFIVDPKLVNVHDVTDPKPGKLIRMRRMAWGQGRIDEGIKQLEVSDVTKGHIEEGSYLLDVMEQSTGATDMAKGVVQDSGPRVSAQQSQSARQSVLSRMQKAARMIGMQAHQPLGELLAMQTQQLMSERSWVKVLGDSDDNIMKGMSKEAQGGKVSVNPEDIIFPFDVKSVDPSVPGSEDMQTWTELYQTVAQNPQLAKEFDMVKMFKHIARQMGAKNVDDFVQRTQGPEVRPDEEVREQAQRGNLQPVEEAQSNGPQR